MNKKLISLAAVSAFAVISAPALAEDAAPAAAPQAEAPAPDWTVIGSVSFVSDYIFRGQSQTFGKPAIQASVEVDHKSGFYAGFAASNVSDQWLPGANLETDLYGGFRGNLPGAASDIGFDIGTIWYIYPGANWSDSGFQPDRGFAATNPNSLDTGEAYLALTYKWLTLKAGIAYTEYFGWNNNNSGVGGGFAGDLGAGVVPGGDTTGSYYYEANAAYEVFPTWTVSGQIGRQVVNDAIGLDITYFKAGVTKGFNGGWSIGAFASVTSEPDAYKNFVGLRDTVSTSDIARTTGFISIGKSF